MKSSQLSTGGAIAILIVAFLLGVLYNDAVYDDWTCIYKSCVVVK